MEVREKARLESEAIKKQMYNEYLKKQISETEKRKKIAGTQMSDTERKMNMKEIEAYANNDTTVRTKMVGFRNEVLPAHHKYISRQYGLKTMEYEKGQSRGSALGLGGYLAINPNIDEVKYPYNTKEPQTQREYHTEYFIFIRITSGNLTGKNINGEGKRLIEGKDIK